MLEVGPARMTPAEPAAESGVARRFRREAHRWDEIYTESGAWITRGWDRLTRRNVRERFTRTFQAAGDLEGRTVLDLGCGSGRYLVEAIHRGAARAVGLDIAPEMIDLARRLAARAPRPDRIELRCGDILGAQLETKFDLVIANGLFDYLDDPDAVMRRAADWTAGTLVASFPDRWAMRALPRALYWRLRQVRVRLYDRAAIAALASRVGLGVVGIERIGPIFLLVARHA